MVLWHKKIGLAKLTTGLPLAWMRFDNDQNVTWDRGAWFTLLLASLRICSWGIQP